MMAFTLGQIAEHLGASLTGDPACQIHGITTLRLAGPGQISFLSNRKYARELAHTEASAVILTPGDQKQCPVFSVVIDDPHMAYAKIANLFHPRVRRAPGIHPSAEISASAVVDDSVTIGAHTVIEDGVMIYPRVSIDSGCVVKAGATIGEDTDVYANVVVADDVSIGRRVILHSGAVIGADGFGFAPRQDGSWMKIPQIGTVIIGDDVEIGANTCVDRGALGDTVIEAGVKIDNHVQVAHNVRIGMHTVIAGCTAIAGSTKIGKYCNIGGLTALSGHIEIADGVTITGSSAVSNSIKVPGIYSSGLPAIDARLWRRLIVRIKNLDKLYREFTQSGIANGKG